MTTPLFIVSAPRSGSTFLRAALGAHPEITLTNEAGWVAALRKAELLTVTPAMQPVDDGEGFTSVGLVPRPYLEHSRAAFTAAAQAYVAAFEKSVGGTGRYFGDKVHSHNDAEFLVRNYPDLRLVYLVRDIRDVLVSSYTFQSKQVTAWQGASFEQRCTHLATFFERMTTILRGRPHIVVRYEELVADPAARLGEIFTFLDLEPAPEVGAWLTEGAGELFTSHGTSSTPGASIGRWRTMLDAEQKAMVEATLTPHLQALGYE